MKKTNLALTLVGLSIVGNAYSLPTIYPTKVTYLSDIKNTTNSNLVADDTDERVFYVMPPNSAKASVLGLHTMNANVGFCREMADTQTYSRNITKKINDLADEEVMMWNEISAVADKVSKARKELADHVTLTKMDDFVALENRILEIELRLTSLYEQLSKCTSISLCNSMRGEVSELRAEKINATNEKRKIAQVMRQETRDYERKKAAVDALLEDKAEKEERVSKIRVRLASIRENFHQMYSSFGNMEGARASISFKSNWDSNIERLRQENPMFDFKKIETQNAVITSNIVDLASVPSGGAILGYDIGGNKEQGKLMLSKYPETFDGNIRLSLLGTCPVLHPDYFDINLPNGTDEMAYGLTVTYEYPSVFLAEAKVTYNMHKMYQKIMKSGSSGGFFSTRSWSSVEERTFFEDSFKVEWLEQDSGNSIPDAQKAEWEREMRNNVFSRLGSIGLPTAVNTGALITPPGIPQSGAIVLANSLQKTCPGNYYCVGAAIAFNVLDSIFGRKQSSSSYTNIQDANLVEQWSRTKVVYKPWISAYSK